jgi:hypothetical protein
MLTTLLLHDINVCSCVFKPPRPAMDVSVDASTADVNDIHAEVCGASIARGHGEVLCCICSKRCSRADRRAHPKGGACHSACRIRELRAAAGSISSVRTQQPSGEQRIIQTRLLAAATATAATAPTATQAEDTNWDPTPEELAAWKPDPQLAAAIAAQEAEWAARTPAQWARRHYLLHVAPRCERCNFPRTGKKGWDEKKQCHTDKDCNTNRWRVLDAFC